MVAIMNNESNEVIDTKRIELDQRRASVDGLPSSFSKDDIVRQIKTSNNEETPLDNEYSSAATKQQQQILHQVSGQNLAYDDKLACKISDNHSKCINDDINIRSSREYNGHDGCKSNDGCFWIFKERMRFIIIILGLVAIVLNQMSRVVFNITIPLMTYPVNSNCHPPSVDACKIDTDSTPSDSLCNMIMINNFAKSDNDNDKDGILRFDWTPAEQDQLLGAFFYTYSGLQIPFGILAERYGAKYLILASVAVSGICNLFTPLIARQEAGLTLLFWSRLLVGASQAAIFPAIYALINQWITATESIVIASLLKMAFRLGALMGSIVPGLVYGWEPSYYITGGICMVWSVLWLLLATSKPQDNSCVSMRELFRIARKKNDRNVILASVQSKPANVDTLQLKPIQRFNSDDKRTIVSTQIEQTINSTSSASDKDTDNDNDNDNDSNNNNNNDNSNTNGNGLPERSLRVWLIIITSRSVIGFVLCKLTVNFTTDFLTGIMPTYIRDLYHGDKTKISLVNSLTATVQVLVSFPISWLVKYTNKSRPFGLKKTGMRRVFSSVTCFGSAFFLSMLTIIKCDLIYASIILQFLATTNMMGGGGEALIPYDLSDQYPATIAAIGNSFSSISGFVIPKLKTIMIGNQTDSVSAWNHYILAIAFLQTIGGLIFIFNVKAKKLDFSVKNTATSDSNNTTSSTKGTETRISIISNENIKTNQVDK